MSLEDHFLSRTDLENRQFLCLQQKDMNPTSASVGGRGGIKNDALALFPMTIQLRFCHGQKLNSSLEERGRLALVSNAANWLILLTTGLRNLLEPQTDTHNT